MHAFRPRIALQDEAPLSPSARLPRLRDAPFASLREPTSRPLKATVGLIERTIAPEALNRRPLAARRHAQFLERTRAERYTCVIDIPTQLFAGQKRLRCWRGYWI